MDDHEHATFPFGPNGWSMGGSVDVAADRGPAYGPSCLSKRGV